MAQRIFFVTGTDTGVGKTVLTTLLAAHLRAQGFAVAAVKPLCSGSRDDARKLRSALGGTFMLNEINPWYFRAPLAPLLAARREGRRVRLAAVLAYLEEIRRRCDVVLIEGAGGVLSPLGEGFSARELIAATRATPIVVSANRLGAINQTMLALAALPASTRRAQVVLLSPRRTGLVHRLNVEFLRAQWREDRVHLLPWLKNVTPTHALSEPKLTSTLQTLVSQLNLRTHVT
jgi:dethiobiotin synthase